MRCICHRNYTNSQVYKLYIVSGQTSNHKMSLKVHGSKTCGRSRVIEKADLSKRILNYNIVCMVLGTSRLCNQKEIGEDVHIAVNVCARLYGWSPMNIIKTFSS